MCDCVAETETTSYFFLRCQFFTNERQKLRDDVYPIDASIKNLNEQSQLMSYYMIQIGLMTVKINKYFSIQSVIFKLPNLSKELLLTGANFVQLLPLCFSLICLPKFICNATFYSLNFSLFIDLSFFERLYWRYQLLSAALHHKRICLR